MFRFTKLTTPQGVPVYVRRSRVNGIDLTVDEPRAVILLMQGSANMRVMESPQEVLRKIDPWWWPF